MNALRSVISSSGSMFSGARTWVGKHLFLAAIIGVVVLGGGYYAYAKATSTEGQTLYSLGVVNRATIVSTVSASGQVSASNQLDISADVSGDVTYIGVKPGQKVGAGAVIARVDSSDAQRALRDAETNLENAKLSLEKIIKPASGLTLTQAKNALASAEDSKRTADENVVKAYMNANADIVSVFLDAPDMVEELENILTGTDAGRSQWNMDYYVNAMMNYTTNAEIFKTDAYQKFTAAEIAYESAYVSYGQLGTDATAIETEVMLKKTETMLNSFAEAVKSTEAFIRLYKTTVEGQQQTVSSSATNAITTLGDLNTKTTTHVTAISGDVSGITSAVQTAASAARTITEKQQSLADVQDGPDTLDVRSAELTVRQREDAVQDARATLEDYSVRAPFAGTIASVSAKAGQRISNGGAIATIVTERKIAELSLNEVDATKVNLGDGATLTFDAIEELTLTGSVAEIDTLGAVEQGVVSYTVKISFDSQDSRIKPGMTVNASIVTESKEDVLTVPASAVKNQNGRSYVLVFEPALADSRGPVASVAEPTRAPVDVGITDDTSIEIISGLTEGQQIVVRTITGTASAGAASTMRPATGSGATGATRAGPPGGAIRF